MQREDHHDWHIVFVEAKLTRSVETFGKQDPYIILKSQGRELKTRTHDSAGYEPKWDQIFDLKVTDMNGDAIIECWDAGATSDTIIGSTTLPISKFVKEGLSDEWVELFYEGKSVGKLNMRSTFTRDNSREV